jgi:hypothetical protein
LEQVVPDAGSQEADLLSLIDLPPDTPVIRRARGETPPDRSITPAPEQEVARPPAFTAPSIEEHGDDWGNLMLERETSTTSAQATSPTTETAPNEESGEKVDKLARDVLDVLRRRLRIEQERRGGKL